MMYNDWGECSDDWDRKNGKVFVYIFQNVFMHIIVGNVR